MSKFKLSNRSLDNLEGIDPSLITLVTKAITDSPIDFGVTEGMRTIERQRHLVTIGASRTMNSRHLTGHAVDLVVWDGGPRWEWPLYYTLAEHIRKWAQILNVRLIWGGAWDIAFTPTVAPCKVLVESYVARRRARSMSAFIDGPHFELVRKTEKA